MEHTDVFESKYLLNPQYQGPLIVAYKKWTEYTHVTFASPVLWTVMSSQCTGGIGTEILRAGPGSLALERNLWNAASCLAYLYYKSVLNLSLRPSLRNKTVKLSGKWTLKLDNLNFNFSNI